jgi:hypothetical protein
LKKTHVYLSLLLSLCGASVAFAEGPAPVLGAPAKKVSSSLSENDAAAKIRNLPEFKQFAKSLAQRFGGKAQAHVFVDEKFEMRGQNKYWSVTVLADNDNLQVHWATFLVRLDGKEVHVVDPGVGEMMSLRAWRTHLANK